MSPKIKLQKGEQPIRHAPVVELQSGKFCIPQHYLQFHHTLESVEEIVGDISFSSSYPVFVFEQEGKIYVQIGIVGFDNYAPIEKQSQKKIVYGRKWRIEKELPTSEIIQTVFLAIKKAREHEIRERFRLKNGKRSTTPFNTHHDIPLMSDHRDMLQKPSENGKGLSAIQEILPRIEYDSARFQLENIEHRKNGKYILDINVIPSERTRLPELQNAREITLVLETLCTNELLFEIMEVCLNLSDRHVDENFTYKGFARFSRKNKVQAVSELSTLTRKIDLHDVQEEFLEAFEQSNYQTDETRVPVLREGVIGNKIRSELLQFGTLKGIPPKYQTSS